VSSATSALHIACRALGVAPGDVVWTSPIGFVAGANSALFCGADVDFVDIDPRTYNISTTALAEKLARSEASGRLPKVVIPVHMCGSHVKWRRSSPSRIATAFVSSKTHRMPSARNSDSPVGSCAHCDIAVFSFHPVKIVKAH